MSKLLTGYQRDCCVQACHRMKDVFKYDPHFFNKIITGDEAWCYGYDPESNNSQHNGSHLAHLDQKRSTSEIECENCLFLTSNGLYTLNCVPENQTVNQQFYLSLWNSFAEVCRDNVQLCGILACGSCIMTMIKRDSQGKHFAKVEDVKRNVTKVLAGIKEDEFKRCFKHWNNHLDKCVNANGEYFEGD